LCSIKTVNGYPPTDLRNQVGGGSGSLEIAEFLNMVRSTPAAARSRFWVPADLSTADKSEFDCPAPPVQNTNTDAISTNTFFIRSPRIIRH